MLLFIGARCDSASTIRLGARRLRLFSVPKGALSRVLATFSFRQPFTSSPETRDDFATPRLRNKIRQSYEREKRKGTDTRFCSQFLLAVFSYSVSRSLVLYRFLLIHS